MDSVAVTDNKKTCSQVKVVVTKDKMAAMMVICKPEKGQTPPEIDYIKSAIANAGVVNGINWEIVENALSSRKWDTPVKIAVGEKSTKGEDADFTYTFDTERNFTPKEDKEGRIDYRSLEFIRNIEKGKVLVTKTPPTDGIDGVNVLGEKITAPRGRDFPFLNGINTSVSEDGLSLVASTGGSIVFTRGNISVNEITTISGDVDMSVGNIDCSGTVKISGNVKAGFKLNIGGNLEIGGNIEDCDINCDGNILIKGGGFGSGQGKIKANGDVIIKYAEGLNITSENGNVISVGELLNCKVRAKENVVVKSQNGKIIGGIIIAGREISASIIGCDTGTKTRLYVGCDDEMLNNYKHTNEEIERIEGDIIRVKKALYELYRLKGDGLLDAEKENTLIKLKEFLEDAPNANNTLNRTKTEIETRMKDLEDASIIVNTTLYPGVEVHIGLVYREILSTFESCRLSIGAGKVALSALKDIPRENHP